MIPARLESQRLPKKPLQDLHGKPLIVRVAENLKPLQEAGCQIVVATDAQEVMQACEAHQIAAAMTRVDHPSGTDRCWEVASGSTASYVLNVQGDEPFVACTDLAAVMHSLEKDPQAAIATAVFASNDEQDFQSPHVVKAIFSQQTKRALYFTRAAAPYPRQSGEPLFYHHIGVYAFRRETLETYCALPPSPLEQRESLEQLRALENDIGVLACEVQDKGFGIDTPEELEAARQRFAKEGH